MESCCMLLRSIYFFHITAPSRGCNSSISRRGQDKFFGPRKWGLAGRLTKTDKDAKRSTIRGRSANEASIVGNDPEGARRAWSFSTRLLPVGSPRRFGIGEKEYRGAISRCNHLAGWICIIQRWEGAHASRPRGNRYNERGPGVGPRHRGPRASTSRTPRAQPPLQPPAGPRRAPFSIPIITSIARIRCGTARLG